MTAEITAFEAHAGVVHYGHTGVLSAVLRDLGAVCLVGATYKLESE
jgi:hypothetical protein